MVHAHVDESDDTVHITLTDRPMSRSEEVRPGIVVKYDDVGAVVGLEVRRTAIEASSQESDPDGLPPPRTPIGVALREARAKMRAQGIPFLTEEELDREIAERRGLPPEERLDLA